MPSATTIFSFDHLTSSAQLGLASHMTSRALHEFSNSSPEFSRFLRLNESTITLSCLRTQYGYIPPSDRHVGPTAKLSMLTHEERLSPTALRLLHFLSRHDNLFTAAEKEELYGVGIRGLVRYITRYQSFKKTMNRVDPQQRERRLRNFLACCYTPRGLSEIIAVYEILCDIVSSRLDGAMGVDEVELYKLQEGLIASLDILDIPERPEEVLKWIERRPEYAESGDGGFFMSPAKYALENGAKIEKARGCAVYTSTGSAVGSEVSLPSSFTMSDIDSAAEVGCIASSFSSSSSSSSSSSCGASEENDCENESEEDLGPENFTYEPVILQLTSGSGSGNGTSSSASISTSTQAMSCVPRFMERVSIGDQQKEGVLRRWGTRLTRSTRARSRRAEACV